MRFLLSLILLVLLSTNISFGGEERTVIVKTPRGDEVKVTVSYPDMPIGTKVPAIVAAPGKGYDLLTCVWFEYLCPLMYWSGSSSFDFASAIPIRRIA
jgi:hypothetical protein